MRETHWDGGSERSSIGSLSLPRHRKPAPKHASCNNASGAAVAPARDAVHPGPQQVDIDLIEPSPYQPRHASARKLWTS